MRCRVMPLVLSVCLVGLVMGGCNLTLNVPPETTVQPSASGLQELDNSVGTVQTTDPRQVSLPDSLTSAGDTVVVDQSVNVVVNVNQEVATIDLPDRTVLGFDNQTGFDIYIQYYADNDFQGVYVYDGETLLLDYPCLSAIELVSEDDIDPFTGDLVDSLVLSEVYLNPEDFLCGDAVILPFEAFTTEIVVDYIDLLP